MEKSVTILVVDDEEAIRRNFRAMLEDMGYRVLVAANGSEGLETFDQERPDMVLTDLGMPVMDGLELIERLKSESPETPIVVVSGWGAQRDAVNAIRHGAWDYLVKPVQGTDELDIVIKRALERARLLAAKRCYEARLEEQVAERTRELQETLRMARSLSLHLESVREEERTRIAREIHDELGQMLTVLHFDLHWLKSRLPGSATQCTQKIDEMGRHVSVTIESVRRIAAELRPQLLDELGLVPALKWQAQEFEKRTGIPCRIETRGLRDEVAEAYATSVFRIVQEALTNVARHAQARRVRIRIAGTGDRLLLEITDNGKGITPEQVDSERSFGLMGIRERAQLCGGDAEITGAAGTGTTIRVSIPVSEKETPGSEDSHR